MKKSIDELRDILQRTLRNEVCRVQSLDNAQDRERVLHQVMSAIIRYAPRNAQLHNALYGDRGDEISCGNCGRPATHTAGGLNRCDRCN